jgi:hypothetical protein
MEGEQAMKRSVVALSIVGLVCAVSLPAANAAVLLKDDFSTDALLKSSATYVQGFGMHARDEDPTLLPWYIYGGELTSSPNDGSSTGGSDGTGANNTQSDPPTVDFLLLTGDKSWADVSMQTKVYSNGQNTGSFALIVRAAPKTKPTDPDSWYEFAYTTNGTTPGDVTPTLEGITHDQDASGIPGTDASPNLRIMKVVNNKWKILAETDYNKSKDHIPEVNNAGADHDTNGDGTGTPTGATFRFVAKGNVLQGFASLDGVKFTKYLEVTDDELKAGKVGLAHCDYDPIFDDLLVEDAP